MTTMQLVANNEGVHSNELRVGGPPSAPSTFQFSYKIQ